MHGNTKRHTLLNVALNFGIYVIKKINSIYVLYLKLKKNLKKKTLTKLKCLSKDIR